MIKNVYWSSCKVTVIFVRFSWQILGRSSSIKFRENPSNGSRVVACENRDKTNLILAFRNFANAPQNATLGNTFVAVSQTVISSYFCILLLNIRRETWSLSLRCRPYVVLQWPRKTFLTFLADNEVVCYVMSFHICVGIGVTPVPVFALIWTEEFLLSMIPCHWHSTDISPDGRNWQRPADITRFGTQNELWDSHSGRPSASVCFNLNWGILTVNDSLPLTFHWHFTWWSQLTTTCRYHQVRHPQRTLRFSQWEGAKCTQTTQLIRKDVIF